MARGTRGGSVPAAAPPGGVVEVEEAGDGIEYGVPIPRVRSEHGWEKFKHGGSKVVPKGASSSARKFVKDSRPGWKVTERAIPGDDKNIRIWFTDETAVAAGEVGGEEANPVE